MDLSNSFKNIDAELKGPTLDVEFDTQSPRDFVEENASHVFTGDVEPKRPEFVIAQKETEVSLINLNTAEEKDDHFPKSMLDFPTVELNVSHVLIDEDGNKKMGNVVTEREIEDLKRDDYFLKSMLDLPTAGVNSSQVLINEDGNEKLDLSVSVRESDDQKKDDHFPKSMLDFPTADANASQVMINENENEKLDLLATERENEDQKKDDHFPKSILDFPTADTNASQVLINEDGNNFFDLFVTERKNEDLKKDDMLDFQTADVNASQVLIYEDGNKKLDLLVTDRENQDKKKNDLTDKSMPEDSSTEPSEKKGEEPFVKIESSNVSEEVTIANSSKELGSENPDEIDESEPVFDGTEILPGMAAIKNFVREKSAVAVSTVVRRLSGKSDDDDNNDDEKVKDENSESVCVSPKESEFQKTGWNPLNLIGISRVENKAEEQEEEEVTEESLLPIPMKGRILLYTRLGCKECKEARIFLRRKKLTYVEINIDVYPSRKLELEKFCGSSSVPRVFFNEILVGGMSEMKSLDEVGKLKDKMEYVVTEAPPYEAPLPPLSGEDDMSTFGSMDELALIVRKMKETIIVKDRFYKMRRFTSCFVGSEAVDFLSEDQYLERKDAVEFGRKLASGLFFQHVLEENIFEDGNHLYRFLDQDPIVSSQCYNIPRGIIEVKPKPVTEISLRLRFLSYAIFEAYTSEDGKHVDYRSIHGSEEFARYLRIIEELQRVDLKDMPREEKLAFFINLFNMMVIHAILVLGYPSGALERRKMLGDFKYIIGGCTYSLSAIQNGILRGNQRPPYNLTKPFGLKDKRAKVALPYPEPLIHFALVFGNRSGPPLRCFSAGEVDKELMEAARSFIRSGGLIVDLNLKVTSVTKILKWYSIDFGKNEVEVLKHAANYLEPVESEAMLELLATTQLKVVYQPYDWGMNN